MTWVGILAVALGGAIGAPVRYLVDHVTVAAFGVRWPYGTFLVNVAGSAILGIITGVALVSDVPTELKLFIGTGFCGALTTFGGFILQAVDLTRFGIDDAASGRSPRGFAYAAVSAGVGLLAAAVPILAASA
jgi:CrcB protein